MAFIAASIAFVTDVVVSILISLITTPKPDKELVGFVRSVTPKDQLVDASETSLPWFRRTVPLGLLCLAMVITLNLIFF